MYIPTALTAREAKALRRYAKDKTVVETGSLLGYSTIQLARTARWVTAIDRHTGYDGAPTRTLRSFRRNLSVAGVEGRVSLVLRDIHSFVQFPAADLTFIDLDGTLETTAIAIQKARSPLIAIHDVQRSCCPGVEEAIRRLNFRVIEGIDSLVIGKA